MKRAAAAGLCAALLCGMCAPAYAADTAAAQTAVQTPVRLTFDTLEKTVREGNVSIRSYQQTVESAEKTDVSDQYINKYFNLSQQIDAYDRQIRELKKSRDGITDTALLASINGQIKLLQAQRESLYRQYNDLDDDEDDAKDEQKNTVNSTRRQMQNNADTICMSAENNYISARVHAVFARTDRAQPAAARPAPSRRRKSRSPSASPQRTRSPACRASASCSRRSRRARRPRRTASGTRSPFSAATRPAPRSPSRRCRA